MYNIYDVPFPDIVDVFEQSSEKGVRGSFALFAIIDTTVAVVKSLSTPLFFEMNPT